MNTTPSDALNRTWQSLKRGNDQAAPRQQGRQESPKRPADSPRSSAAAACGETGSPLQVDENEAPQLPSPTSDSSSTSLALSPSPAHSLSVARPRSPAFTGSGCSHSFLDFCRYSWGKGPHFISELASHPTFSWAFQSAIRSISAAFRESSRFQSSWNMPPRSQTIWDSYSISTMQRQRLNLMVIGFVRIALVHTMLCFQKRYAVGRPLYVTLFLYCIFVTLCLGTSPPPSSRACFPRDITPACTTTHPRASPSCRGTLVV